MKDSLDSLSQGALEAYRRGELADVLYADDTILIGSDAKILDAFQRLFPTGYQRASTIVTKWMK